MCYVWHYILNFIQRALHYFRSKLRNRSQSSTHQIMTIESNILIEKSWLNLQFHDDERRNIKMPHELEEIMIEPPNPIDEDLFNRIAGSMVGMALGDALGAHVEFRPHQYLLDNPVTDLGSGGTWGLRKGQFTDDTSMALCLASSLVVKHSFSLYDQLVRYKWWYRKGYMSSTGECFDIGSATRSSIEEFIDRQHRFAKEHNIEKNQIDFLSDTRLLGKFDVYCSEEGVAGNGALMRLAPVPLFFFRSPKEAVEYSGQSGQITHGDIEAYDACRYYGALIIAAIQGLKKEEILDDNFYQNHQDWFGNKPLSEKIESIAEGSFKKTGGYADGIRGKGYIVNALEAALWAFWFHDSFEEGALAAVNLGDDTDTTAAIYGQLAGAYYGLKDLPQKWVDVVYAREFLLNLSKWLVYEGAKSTPSQVTQPATGEPIDADLETQKTNQPNAGSDFITELDTGVTNSTPNNTATSRTPEFGETDDKRPTEPALPYNIVGTQSSTVNNTHPKATTHSATKGNQQEAHDLFAEPTNAKETAADATEGQNPSPNEMDSNAINNQTSSETKPIALTGQTSEDVTSSTLNGEALGENNTTPVASHPQATQTTESETQSKEAEAMNEDNAKTHTTDEKTPESETQSKEAEALNEDNAKTHTTDEKTPESETQTLDDDGSNKNNTKPATSDGEPSQPTEPETETRDDERSNRSKTQIDALDSQMSQPTARDTETLVSEASNVHNTLSHVPNGQKTPETEPEAHTLDTGESNKNNEKTDTSDSRTSPSKELENESVDAKASKKNNTETVNVCDLASNRNDSDGNK